MITKIGLYRDPRNKNKPWVVRWFGEYDPATGKEKRYSKAFRLKVEAEAFQAEQAAAFKTSLRRDKPEEITLKDFCSDWLRTRKPDLKPETVSLYENALRRLLDYYGVNMPLSQITPRSASKFIAELKRLDNKNGELSNWSRHRTLRNCCTLFNSAVDWELIGKSPFATVKRPKLVTRSWHYLQPDEYRRLLQVSPLRWKALYSIAYGCALRRGELISLLWTDVNVEIAEVRIQNRPATATLPGFFVKDDESRTIPLPKHTCNILTDLKTYNSATDKTPYVLLNEQQYNTVLAKWKRFKQQNRPWRNRDMQNNTLKIFERHLKWADIKAMGTLSIHTLRKSCIQNWANNINNPEVVRVLAGHADLKTTMKYYAQADKEQRERAAAVMDDLLRETDVRMTY